MVLDIKFIQNTLFIHSLFLSRCELWNSQLEGIDLFFEQLRLLCVIVLHVKYCLFPLHKDVLDIAFVYNTG